MYSKYSLGFLILLGFSGLSVAIAAPLETPAAKAYYAEESKAIEDIKKDLANRNLELAKWCKKMGLARRARFHYLRVISYAPNHEEARKALGHAKDGPTWLYPKEDPFPIDPNDPIANPTKENVDKWVSYESMHNVLIEARANLDLKLANKAKKAELPHEESKILRRITNYARNKVEARNRLGDSVSTRGDTIDQTRIWRTAYGRKAFEKGKVQGPLPKLNEEESKLKVLMQVYQTEHFRFGTQLPETHGKNYAQLVEAGYAYILGLSPKFSQKENSMNQVYVFLGDLDFKKALENGIKPPENSKQFIDNCFERKIYRNEGGFMLEQLELIHGMGLDGKIIHVAAEVAMTKVFGKHYPWFTEGLASMAALEINEASSPSCAPFVFGSAVQKVNHWAKAQDWPELIVETVLLQKDGTAKELFQADWNALKPHHVAKAWSILQYLRMQDAQKFEMFVEEVANQVAPGEAIQKVYSLDPNQLDTKWREWALFNY